MPYHFQLIVHYQQNSFLYPSEIEDKDEQKEYEEAPVPTLERPSLGDAVFFRQLLAVLTLRKGELSYADYAGILLLCRTKSPAFSEHSEFASRYAAIIQQQLTAEKKSTVSEIFNKMLAQNVAMDKGKLQKFLAGSARKKSSYSRATRVFNPAIQNYFTKLGIRDDNNDKSSDGYLLQNFSRTAREKLLYVRQCEHPHCDLSPDHSKFMRAIHTEVVSKVVKFIKKRDKKETIYYGGFASGYLLRDLFILAELIKSGYKNLKIFFLDKSFINLIKLTQEQPENLSVFDEIELRTAHKAILEFSSWLSAQVNCSKEQPLEIHLFGSIEEAEYYFKAAKEKLTVLVGEDYEDTSDAHPHFMRMAKVALANDHAGRFFELIKSATKEKSYLYVGRIKNGTTIPLDTREIDPAKKTTTVYLTASLGLFSANCRDETITSERKDLWFVRNENREIIRYSGPEVEQYIRRHQHL